MQWWFYHKVDPEEFLVSKCEEVKGNRAPDVHLKASQKVAFEFFTKCAKHLTTRDLVEEFVASRVWTLSWGWTILKFGGKELEGLCHLQPNF